MGCRGALQSAPRILGNLPIILGLLVPDTFTDGRRIRRLDQTAIDQELDVCDILSNCRQHPKDDAPDAYKDFGEVLESVELAGMATPVAKLKARFVIKDGDKAHD
jgi:hypothetical protein